MLNHLQSGHALQIYTQMVGNMPTVHFALTTNKFIVTN